MEEEEEEEEEAEEQVEGSALFGGTRMLLAGFDPMLQKQVAAEIERNGGTLLLGSYDESCTHVIVSQLPYDDSICKIAREHGKQLLCDSWVVDCLDYGTILDVKSVLYKPLQDLKGIPGSQTLCICLTGYQGKARRDILRMVEMIGAKFTKPLIASKVTHLICYKFEGDKYNLAKRLGIKLVNHCWLEDCLKQWKLLPEESYGLSGWELELANEEARDSEESQDVKTCAGEATADQQSCFLVDKNLKEPNKLDESQISTLLQKNPSTFSELSVLEKTNDDSLIQATKNQNAADATTVCSPQVSAPKNMLSTNPKNTAKGTKKKMGDTHDDWQLEAQKERSIHSEKKIRNSVDDEGSLKVVSPLEKISSLLKVHHSSRASLGSNWSDAKEIPEQELITPEGKKLKCNRRYSCLSEKKEINGESDTKRVTLSVQSRAIEANQNAKITVQSCIKQTTENESENNHTHVLTIDTITGSPASKAPLPAHEDKMQQSEVLNTVSRDTHAGNADKQGVSGTRLAGLGPTGTDNVDKENIPLIANVSRSSKKSRTKGGLSERHSSKRCRGSSIKELGITRSSKGECKENNSCEAGQPNQENPERETATSPLEAISKLPTNAEVKQLNIAKNLSKELLGTLCVAEEQSELQHLNKDLDHTDRFTYEKSFLDPGNSELQKPAENISGPKTFSECPRKRQKKGKTSVISASHEESGLLSAPKTWPSPSMNVEFSVKEKVKLKEEIFEEHKTSDLKEPSDMTRTSQKKGKKGWSKNKAKACRLEKEKMGKVQLHKLEESSAMIQKRYFAMSGHRHEKEKFLKIIKQLEGHASKNDHQWNNRVTHVVFATPLRRTEKFFAAAAAGRWILKGEYLEASRQAGKFLSEEAYEWYGDGDNDEGTINLGAPRKWRLRREITGCEAFYGMRVIIYGECISPPLNTLRRAIKAGGGTLLATAPPYTRHLLSGVDYAVVSFGILKDDQYVSEFLKYKVACVASDYLVEFICKPFSPLVRHVLYGSEAAAEIARKRLADLADSFGKTHSNKKTQDGKSQKHARQSETGDFSDPAVDIACSVCALTDREDVMLLCGNDEGQGCGVAIHIDCCNPPLKAVPEEDWFCNACSGVKAA